VWNGPKEAFSLRKLQQLSLLPEPDQMAAIESLSSCSGGDGSEAEGIVSRDS